MSFRPARTAIVGLATAAVVLLVEAGPGAAVIGALPAAFSVTKTATATATATRPATQTVTQTPTQTQTQTRATSAAATATRSITVTPSSTNAASTARSTSSAVAAAVTPATVISRSHLAASATTPVLPHTLVVAGLPEASTWIPNQQVYALATDGTYVYLGGDFTSMTNPADTTTTSYTRLARVSLATGLPDATWTPTVDGSVRALAMDTANSTLYLGGTFTTVDGQSRTNLAAVSTADTGSLLPFSTAVTISSGTTSEAVRSLLLDGSQLVVGGGFTQIGAIKQTHLAKVFLPGGAVNTTFQPVVAGSVFAINEPPAGNRYAIGGNFLSVGGVSHADVAMVDSSTGAVSAWTADTYCTPTAKTPCLVLSLASNATQLFVAAGGPGGRLAAFNLNTGNKQWAIVSDGDNQALALIQGEVFVGGHFDPKFGSDKRQTLAGVDAATGDVDENFAPSAKHTFPGTWALLSTSAGLVVGGAQQNIAGTVHSDFAIFPSTLVNKRTGVGLGTRLTASHQH